MPGCPTASGGFQSPCQTVTNKHWSNEQFKEIHNPSKNLFVGADLSWIESRKFNELAIDALAAQSSTDPAAAGLLRDIQQRIPKLRPQRPHFAGLEPGPHGTKFTCGAMQLGLDPVSGGISELSFHHSSDGFDSDGGGGGGAVVPPLPESWASETAQLLDLRYMTYNDRSNLTCKEPGCPNPVPGMAMNHA